MAIQLVVSDTVPVEINPVDLKRQIGLGTVRKIFNDLSSKCQMVIRDFTIPNLVTVDMKVYYWS
jgi:hypothetical protein